MTFPRVDNEIISCTAAVVSGLEHNQEVEYKEFYMLSRREWCPEFLGRYANHPGILYHKIKTILEAA